MINGILVAASIILSTTCFFLLNRNSLYAVGTLSFFFGMFALTRIVKSQGFIAHFSKVILITTSTLSIAAMALRFSTHN